MLIRKTGSIELILPDAGDTIYTTEYDEEIPCFNIVEYKVQKIEVEQNTIATLISSDGKTIQMYITGNFWDDWFMTREEAEKRAEYRDFIYGVEQAIMDKKTAEQRGKT